VFNSVALAVPVDVNHDRRARFDVRPRGSSIVTARLSLSVIHSLPLALVSA